MSDSSYGINTDYDDIKRAESLWKSIRNEKRITSLQFN